MYQYSACSRPPAVCSSPGYACTTLPVLQPSTIVAKGRRRRKADISASRRLCGGRASSDTTRAISSQAADNTPAVARVASLAVAGLLVFPASGSYAAADLAADLLGPSEQHRPFASYNNDISSLQLIAVPAPNLTAALVPATPFQAPRNLTPPAVADPKAPPASSQDSNSNGSPSTSTQQQQGSSTPNPLDPPTPPNSPKTPPPPQTPLPTPDQPHFPLLPNSPPPALPPQLLPPNKQPPPTKLLHQAPSDNIPQGDLQAVGLGAGMLATSSSEAYSLPYSDMSMLSVEAAQAADGPVSLLQLYKNEQQLQEQWQDVLLYTAIAEGSTSGLAVQEPSALPLPGDMPLSYFDRDLTQSERQTAPAESGGMLYAGLVGNSTSTVPVLPPYSAAEPGLVSAVSFADNEEIVAAGSADSAAGDGLRASQGTSAQQLSSKLSEDVAIQQLLEAVPAAAHCPESATVVPADFNPAASSKGSGSSTAQARFAASAVVATATDSSIAEQGSTGMSVTPMQGGGAAGAGAAGESAAVSNTAPTETRESAKAAKDIQQGIQSARQQIVARSKQLEYESPGYEQLLDASKRLLIALLAIAQFLIKVALSLGVFLVKGLVQLIEWFLNR